YHLFNILSFPTRRSSDLKQINASCGLDPTIVQSGKSINYHGPISKRGNKYARKILFNCSRNIVTVSAKCDKENPIYVYYQKKKQDRKSTRLNSSHVSISY